MTKSTMKIIAIALLAAALGGCITPRLYDWGSYDKDLYASYKAPEKVVELTKNLEETIADSHKDGKKVAPGLYAELGTLYLQAGKTDKAIDMYKLERDTWPESKGLMTAMIGNLERRQQEQKKEASL
jgi:hypothetical protein